MNLNFTIVVNSEPLQCNKESLTNSPYFLNMFDYGSDSCTFDVKRPDVLKDLILSLHGNKLPLRQSWDYKLYMIKYSTMLLLPFPYEVLEIYTLVVPDYDLLLEIALPLINEHKVMLSLLRANLPDNYRHISYKIKRRDKLVCDCNLQGSYWYITVRNLDLDTVVFDTLSLSSAKMTKYGILCIQNKNETAIIDVRTGNSVHMSGKLYFFSDDKRTLVTIERINKRISISAYDHRLMPINPELRDIVGKDIDIYGCNLAILTRDRQIMHYNLKTRILRIVAENVVCNTVSIKGDYIAETSGIRHKI